MPFLTISVAEPQGVATIGVPHANASIITMPNGSGQAIGLSRHSASAEELCLARSTDLTEVLDVTAQQGLDPFVVVRELVLLAHLGRDAEWDAGGPGDLDGVVDAFLGAHPAEEQGVSSSARSERELVDVDAVVDHRRDRDAPGAGRLVM